jgi:L-fucose isomerase-like protein
MAKSSGSKPSRIAAEERMLEQQREEIMRKTQELEHKLKVLPTVIEAQEEQRRALAKRRAASAGRAISPYTLGGGGRRTRAKGTQTPSRQRYAAQIKTMALLIALAIIFTLLWRVVPAT